MEKTVTQGKNNMGQLRLPQWLLSYLPFMFAAVCFAICLAIELLHIEIDSNARKQFYSVFGSICYYCSILLSTIHGRKYGLGWFRSLIFSGFTFLLLFTSFSVVWTDLDVRIFGTGTVAAFRAILPLPLLCLVFSRFCKVDTLNLCDYLTPYFFFNHGIVTVACWIQGCCAGKACSWGLQNPLSGMTVFPLQPCIILLSTAVAWWGLTCARKHNYRANGMVFANSLILYGLFRYLLELFSDDPRVFWVLSWLSVCSLAMIAEGFLVRHFAMKRTQTP